MRALACRQRWRAGGGRRVVWGADHYREPVWMVRASFARPSHVVVAPDSDATAFDPFTRPHLPPATKLVNPVAETVRACA